MARILEPLPCGRCDGIPGSWFQPSPGAWGANHGGNTDFSLSLSLLLFETQRICISPAHSTPCENSRPPRISPKERNQKTHSPRGSAATNTRLESRGLWPLAGPTGEPHSPNRLLSEESVESLGYHWGSWVGEAIQLGWGLLGGE